MSWALAVVTLLVVGYVCRRILRLDNASPRPRGLSPLPAHLEKIYRPVSLEVETQIVLLGISLNEALGERDSGNEENAWRLVRLSLCQWERLAEIVSILLNAISDYFPQTRSLASVRDLTAGQFKSQAMIEFMRVGAMVHQVIFRSKSRYQFHIRVIRRAMDTLTVEFRDACEVAEQRPDASPQLWNNIDPSFHDFDLVVKESLLAFRAFLPALPASVLAELSVELSEVVRHSVRSKSASTFNRAT
jgi:hypothetical protein